MFLTDDWRTVEVSFAMVKTNKCEARKELSNDISRPLPNLNVNWGERTKYFRD